MTGFGLSTSIYNLISDSIINPEDTKLLENNFYPREVADRVPNYIRFVVINFILSGTLVVIFLFPAKEEKFELKGTSSEIVKILE